MPTNKERDDYFNDGPVEPVAALESLVGGPLLAGKVGAGILRNRVKNIVTDVPPGRSTLFTGRLPSPGVAPTHAYRNTKPDEIQAIAATGRARKSPTPQKWGNDSKWWSPGDEAGAFGRAWKDGGGETIRAPIDKVKGSSWAVKAKDLERLSKEGKFEKFAKGGTVRGAGCATKGVKKCKIR
jgi:hypothetical protein